MAKPIGRRRSARWRWGRRSMRIVSGSQYTTNVRPDEILCFLKVRNERLRLPSVLAHHRSLGVDRFLIVDNDSDDGTVELLQQQRDVSLFVTDEKYGSSQGGANWLHSILDEFADSRWVLILDADELFVYPDYEKKKLGTLCTFLDSRQQMSMFATMVDMYSTKIISKTVHRPGRSLIETCSYFDAAGYECVSTDLFPYKFVLGGVRKRRFWDPFAGHLPPVISKVPLLKWRKGYRFNWAAHTMFNAPESITEATGALLHFKFLSDFHQRAKLESKRGQMWNGAQEYKQYLKHLEANRNTGLCLYGDWSCRYENSQTLINARIMSSSAEWNEF